MKDTHRRAGSAPRGSSLLSPPVPSSSATTTRFRVRPPIKALQRPLFICDHAERILCPLPLKIDTYRGCSTRCAYCASNGLRTGINVGNAVNGAHAVNVGPAVPDIGSYYAHCGHVHAVNAPAGVNVQPNSIRYIEKFFYSRKIGMERALIDQRSPIQIGVSADPLQPVEKQYHVTLRVLKILQDRQYPTVITTKYPGQLTGSRYLQAIDGLPLAVQCSISTEDPAMLQRLEPGAPPLEERMAALQTLSDAGAHAQLRLWPYIPDLAGNLEKLLGMAHDVGVNDVLCNHLKIYHAGGTCQKINAAIGRDYLKTTHLRYLNGGLFKVASYEDQLRELSHVRDLCRTFGLNLLTCDDFIGTRNWADCCGVGQYPGFKPSPWAYYVNGWRITDNTTFKEYISNYDCPWHDEFQAEWDRGKLARSVSGLRFNKVDKTYSRSW